MKKKIAVIVQSLNNGGAERMAANLATELNNYYDVYLIVFDAKNAIYSTTANIVDLELPPKKISTVLERVVTVIKRTRKIKKIKKQNDISLSIGHMGGANLVNILSKNKDKVVSVFHSMPSSDLNGTMLAKFIQQFICKYSDKYIMVSELGAYDMVNNFGVNPKKVKCIHNFCNVENIRKLSHERIVDDRANLFFESHEKILINVGRMSEEKAQSHLVKVFSEIQKSNKKIGLIILGDGPKREELVELVNHYKMQDDVFMPGEVSNPFSYLTKADLFVLCSYYEGLPMVLIEAAACNCPIVSTDMKSGAREVLAPNSDYLTEAKEVEYGEYGILTPAFEKQSFVKDKFTYEERCLIDAINTILNDTNLYSEYRAKLDSCAALYNSVNIIKEWKDIIEGRE